MEYNKTRLLNTCSFVIECNADSLFFSKCNTFEFFGDSGTLISKAGLMLPVHSPQELFVYSN